MTEPTPPSPTKRPASKQSYDGDTQQSGRQPTALHAHRSLSSLSHAASFESAHSKGSQRHHQRNGSAPVQAPIVEAEGDADTTTSPADASRPQPSPVQDTAADISPSTSSSQDRQSHEAVRSKQGNAALGAAIASAAGLPPPGRIPASRNGQIASRGSWTSSTGNSTPRSVHDLGADYSRYYNPFSSRNASTSDLMSPQSGFAASSSNLHLPLLGAQEKRHSNPFDDKKQAHETKDEKPALKKSDPAAGVVLASVPLSQPGARDPEKSFFPYLDDRFGAPGTDASGYNFPMLWDEKEDDDDMHMPMVDDDVKYKPKMKDRLSRENICSTLGLAFMVLGLLTLFVILPALSSTGLNIIGYSGETPIDQFPKYAKAEAWAQVNDRDYPLMKNIRTGLIDPDTPDAVKTKTSLVDGQELKLVFSDEFNQPNRTFYKGDDPFWFGADFWYGATKDLEWYDPDAVNTGDGVLQLQLDAYPNHGLQYRSGMVNSWNQLCFKGGIWEVSVSLPGPAGVHGLWPGVWSMGNLGRPGYLSTTDGLWPYTYNDCDTGITPNQSMTDGTSRLPGQRLASCTCSNEDHPSPGTGRGAPEIDILEGAADWGMQGWGTATQSFQVAPFDIWYYPNYDFFATPNYNHSVVNGYTGGPYQQAVSVTSVLNNDWYDGNAYQRYSYDYRPGSDEDAHVAFIVADDIQGVFDARALGPNGNIQQRQISEEPMSMIMNLGISPSWTNINFGALKFPATMRIDYVRIYQREGEESITCDPEGFPTTQYIQQHPEAYQNVNYTHWTDIPGYTWPKNTLMNGCSA